MSEIIGCCLADHALFQEIGDADWKCPQCGAGYPDFYVDSKVENSSEDCNLVHVDDEITCLKCHSYWYGSEFAKQLTKKQNLVVCPYCKGKGTCTKEEAEAFNSLPKTTIPSLVH